MPSLVPKAAQITLSTTALEKTIVHTIQSPVQKWAKQKALSLGGIFNMHVVFPGHNANHLCDLIKLIVRQRCKKKDLKGESDYC